CATILPFEINGDSNRQPDDADIAPALHCWGCILSHEKKKDSFRRPVHQKGFVVFHTVSNENQSI
ncbi:MAG: hypothetical protein ACI3XE_02975, partial [Eubacteriales bacterium]